MYIGETFSTRDDVCVYLVNDEDWALWIYKCTRIACWYLVKGLGKRMLALVMLIDIHKSLEYSCFIMIYPDSTSGRL